MPELNRTKLEENLGINEEPIVINEPIYNNIPIVEEDDYEDGIIKANIERANNMLDRVEDEMDRGNFNSRMVEVFSKLVDSVTTAASQIQSSSYNSDYLVLKEKLAALKEIEVKAKVKNITSGGGTHKTEIENQQNIIVTDRESILKVLKEGK